MPPNIAIAVSGLGRIRRGSETWAMDLAAALHARGTQVRLHGSARVDSTAPQTPLWSIGRNSIWLRALDARRRYLVEQRTFARSLIRRLRRDPTDIVHVTDPQVAWWVREAFRGSAAPKVFYMDGLMLGPDWNWRFDHVQVLAPYYLESAKSAGRDTKGWRIIPHFVDTGQFRPASARVEDRRRLLPGVPDGKAVVLAAGDFGTCSSKRLDHVIRELARLPAKDRPHLLLVGNATTSERNAIESLARGQLDDGVTLHTGLRRQEMPAVYRCADLFAHAALREPFGIVLLEAMSSGLPVVAHGFPVTQWIVGDGGTTVDMEASGPLADTVGRWIRCPDERHAAGHRARARIVATFSDTAVVPMYRDGYAAIDGVEGGQP